MVVMLLSITLSVGLGVLFSISLSMIARDRTMMELSFGITRNYYVKSTLLANLKVVFGSGSLLEWLSPFHCPYLDNLEM